MHAPTRTDGLTPLHQRQRYSSVSSVSSRPPPQPPPPSSLPPREPTTDERAQAPTVAPARARAPRSRALTRRAEQARARIEQARARVEQVTPRLPGYRYAIVAMERDRRSAGSLLAGALAFRLFAAILPMALVLAVVLGWAKSSSGDIAHAVGIRQTLIDSIASSSRLSSTSRWIVIGSGVIALLWASAVAARAIRMVQAIAWRIDPREVRMRLQGGVALIVVGLAVGGVWSASADARSSLGVFGLPLTILAIGAFFVIWLGASWLLPRRTTRWRELVPGAVVMAVGLQAMHLVTVLWFSGYLERRTATYGALGAAVGILLWLYLLCRLMVGSALVNAVLWEHRYPEQAERLPRLAGSDRDRQQEPA